MHAFAFADPRATRATEGRECLVPECEELRFPFPHPQLSMRYGKKAPAPMKVAPSRTGPLATNSRTRGKRGSRIVPGIDWPVGNGSRSRNGSVGRVGLGQSRAEPGSSGCEPSRRFAQGESRVERTGKETEVYDATPKTPDGRRESTSASHSNVVEVRHVRCFSFGTTHRASTSPFT